MHGRAVFRAAAGPMAAPLAASASAGMAWSPASSKQQSRVALSLVQSVPLAIAVLAAAYLLLASTSTTHGAADGHSAFGTAGMMDAGLTSPGAAVAVLCVVAAAPVSHVSGMAQLRGQGYRIWQPGAGGDAFVFFQGVGWTAYGTALLQHWLLAQTDSLVALGLLATTALAISVPVWNPSEARVVLSSDSIREAPLKTGMGAGACLGGFGLIALLATRSPQPLAPVGEGWAGLSGDDIHVFEGRQLQQDDETTRPHIRPLSQDLHRQTMAAVSGVLLVIAGIATVAVLAKACEIFSLPKRARSASATGGTPQLISRLSDASGRLLSTIFEVCAKACARYPKRVVAVAWLLVMLMCVGFTRLKINDDLSIWIPTTSRVQAEFVAYDGLFSPLPRAQSM